MAAVPAVRTSGEGVQDLAAGLSPKMLRALITASIMAATLMNSLDSTIANVALPHIQGSVSAAADQITWVLTSYIVAAAIMTPLTGWLAGRFGRKRVFLISVAGFTVASMLCGIAASLPEIVFFRLLQGICGAALIPLSQAVLLDTYPPEQHGQAMAIWGAGAVLGPILGPSLGGWLTDNFSWRWVFFVNLPFGILSGLGILAFVREHRREGPSRFDFFGFFTLAAFIGGLQLMLDRGETQDWFGSAEIWIEAIVAVLGLATFVIHSLTAEKPILPPSLLKDRNFATATVLGFVVGVVLFATLALLPPMMETLLGYPVVTTGLVSSPRGIGSFISMMIVGRLIVRFDVRLIMLLGLGLTAFTFFQMSGFALNMNSSPIIWTGVISGLGTGLIFVPLSTIGFATLNPQLRTEAASIFTLIRNLGASVGIALMQALLTSNTATVHAGLAGQIAPGDPRLQGAFDLSGAADAAALNAEITRQAAMVAYDDGFRLMMWLALASMPLLLLMRRPRNPAGAAAVHMD